MADALLGGVLPTIYSKADELKRGLVNWLKNPTEQAKNVSSEVVGAHLQHQDLMRQAFGDPTNPLKITNQQAFNQAGEALLGGPLSFAPVGMIAYHGSPHTFEKFDMSKVGTGEGAQAYGHGMYFAEHPVTAESYAVKGANQGRMPTPPRPTDFLTDNSRFFKENDQLFKQVGNKLDYIPVSKEEYGQALRKVQSEFQTKNQAGNLYKVDIPDEHIPTMMDWDKPLGQQSAFVKKAINNLKKQVTPEMKMELGGDMNLLFGKDITPNQFLNTWEIIHPTGGTGIGEKLLNEQGVKGIRYLDNQSRDVGKGTSNFVVFDPSTVKILERNNQPLTRKELIEQELNKLK